MKLREGFEVESIAYILYLGTEVPRHVLGRRLPPLCTVLQVMFL